MVKNTDPNKFYGNKNKKIVIEGVEYSSVSEASNKLIIYGGHGNDSKPLLSCGARVIIETESDIKMIDPIYYKDIKK